jgi:hypothetical protein
MDDRAIKTAVMRIAERRVIGVADVSPYCKGRQHAVRILEELVEAGRLDPVVSGGFVSHQATEERVRRPDKW